MGKVEKFAKEKDPDEFLEREGKKETSMICAYRYFRNTVGASTDSPQRESRHQELITALLG